MPSPPRELDAHPFQKRPHRTLVRLSVPILISLIAEPVTGLVDTAFVARLGAGPLAALGIGTVLLSSVFWVFNFLMIGTQTEVSRETGAGRPETARRISSLALALSALFGLLLTAAGLLLSETAATAMGASPEFLAETAAYLRIRLLSAPAILITMTSFGALRGLQDMRTPLWIAASINALNAVLDAILIPGAGPIPSYGVAGAAWATTTSQWLGAIWSLAVISRRVGFEPHLRFSEATKLLLVGRDLFLRTGLLTGFLLLTTRTATRIGADAGAAHQAIRQVWIFSALVLDAFAASAQTLVGYFLGGARPDIARRVARISCLWGVSTGCGLSISMILGETWVAALLVPETAQVLFASSWIASALAQPLNALSFVTDGIHWGTSDYRYLRNVMAIATVVGAASLLLIDEATPHALLWVWIVTGGWISIRTLLGLLRVWPGLGKSPLDPIAASVHDLTPEAGK